MKKTRLSLDEVRQIHQAGRLEEARRGYHEILKDHPKDIQALHFLGIIYAEEGNLDKAQAYLEKAIKLNTSDPIPYLHLANILKARGLFSQAGQMLLDVLHAHPKFAAAYNNLGTVYYAQAKLNQAVETYQKAIDLQPNYVDAYYNLGLALSKLNRRQEAINTYEAVLQLSSQHTGAQFQLGCLLMQQANYQKAADMFAEIERLHPFHFETQTNLATCYLKLGRLLDAATHYLKALEIMPNDMQILFNLGVIYMQLGRIQEAIDFYSRAAKINPDLYDAHNNLAFAYLTMRKNTEALYHFREALRIQPQNEAVRHTINILTQEKNIKTSPPEYIRSLFDSYADHFDAHLTQVLNYQVPQKLHQVLTSHVDMHHVKWRILDLGCGTGLCGILFKSFAHSLVGVDLSEKMLQVASQRNIYDELIQSDLLDFLADKKEQFDLIIGGDVLVYFGDLGVLFPAISQALKPNAYFVFDTEIHAEEDFLIMPSGRFAHSKKYLNQLALENHFKIIHYEEALLRQQDQKPVYGHVYVLQKTEALPQK